MPHCIINHTRGVESEININDLLDRAFAAVESSGHFDRSAIKARAIGFDVYRSGLSTDEYIHIDLKILSGRTSEQKKAISDHMISALKPHIGTASSLTVDIIDMEIEAYGKLITS